MQLAAGLGIPEEEISKAVINPATSRPISHVTLRKHFREDLDQGILKVKLKGGSNLLALTATNAACAIFFAKCRLGFNERASWIPTPSHPAPGSNNVPFGEFQEAEVSVAEGKGMTEIARRIAWTLTMGARAPAEPGPKPGKNRVKKAVKKQPQPV